MDKISLALIAPELYPNWGGVGTYSIELIKQLSDKVDIHVLTVDRTIQGSAKKYSKKEVLDYFDGKINIHFLSDADDTFLYNAYFQKSMMNFLPKLIKEHNIDLIHSQHAHMSDILYKFTKKDDVKTVTTLHTTIKGQRDGIKISNMKFSNLEPSEKYQLILYRALLLAERYSLNRCSNYITVSNWMKKELKKQYRNISNVNVIYNGTDPDIFKPVKSRENKIFKTEDPVVLFSSRMTAIKGAHYLIDAIPEIIKQHPEVHFAFVGAGDVTPWVQQLRKNGVHKKCFSFLGYMDYSQLPILYSEAYCYLLPTLYENFPIRMLEAMSSETPVVASKVCGIPEAIVNGKNGILIKSQNVNQLATAVIQMLDDEKTTRSMGRAAREDVINKFRWQTCADKTLEYYGKILAGKEKQA